ncbi:sensor histidine kinase [Streptomyces decoyicus]|uniref:sensor histidine kinase n=1 Tax=Streptomyces decoyicus TaxID=249567 RepID=UPI00069D8192|nr:histidine kinase [Streptomyces decoyicus]KOG39579.1 histidine kinase [Streptomyces decoyicus]QZY14211.1 two-component sensor histidine kinase [Streptomyces decoyicus]
MSSSAPPVSENSPSRSPFAGPGEQGRQLWRAAGEAVLAGALVLLTYQGESWIEARLTGGAPALALVGVALVLVRRRFPVASVLGLAALMGAVPAVALLTAVAAYTAARQLETPRRRAGLLLGAAAAAMAVCVVSAPHLELGSWLFGLALSAVLAVITVVVPGLVGVAAGQQDRLLRALRERTAAAEEAQRLADSESRVRERSRIAAEMHDLVGHRLSLVSLHAGGLEMALLKEAPGLRDEAAVVGRAARDAMQELREVLGVLGPLGRDTGTEALTDATGTRADIEALVEESRGVGIPVEFCWEGQDLDARPARVRRAVHRVVRESLTNVHRYATGAHVTVVVRHTDERVEVRVRNGVPPVPPAAATGLGSGRGLTGLRERVALLNGSLEAHRTPGGGFAVTAGLPADPGPGAETAEAAPYDAGPAAVDEPGGGLSAFQRRLAGAVTGLLGLVGVGVMMLFGVLLVSHSRYDLAYRSPEKPRVGMTKERVLRAVAPDDDVARAAAAGREPPRPGSATGCLYPYTDRAEGGRLEIVRYCFRADTLIAIDRFTVPIVTEKATEPPHGSRKHD